MLVASALAGVAFCALCPSAPADGRATLKPVAESDGGVRFDLTGVGAEVAIDARLKLKPRRSMVRRKLRNKDSARQRRHARSVIRQKLRQRIDPRRVRKAARSGSPLRLHMTRIARTGTLKLRIGDPLAEASGCRVNAATLVSVGCHGVKADTAAQANSLSLWRRLDCANASRQAFMTSGGDPAPTATGESQGNSSYRQLTVLDGDAAYSGTYYSERCELGKNNLSDTFQLYGEGERRITFASFRLPQSYPLAVDSWHQVVMQMKQTQPSNNGGGPPILGLHAIGGRWKLNQSDSAGPSSHSSTIWSTPAQKGVWTRVALDVTYSQDRDLGRIKLYVDANGDGDAADAGEQSQTIHTYTLKRETRGSRHSVPVGDSIPSHLRVGPYRSPDLDCPATGCSVQVDNVEVVRAG